MTKKNRRALNCRIAFMALAAFVLVESSVGEDFSEGQAGAYSISAVLSSEASIVNQASISFSVAPWQMEPCTSCTPPSSVDSWMIY